MNQASNIDMNNSDRKPYNFLIFPIILWFFFGSAVLAQEPSATNTPAPENNQATQLLIEGMTRAFQRDYQEAISAYEKALLAAPGQAAILFALAEAHHENGNRQGALFYAQQASHAAPMNRVYIGFWAKLLDQQGDAGRATQLWQQFADQHPTDLVALTHLSALQLQSGNTNDAIETFRRMVALRPDNILYTLKLAELYERIGNFQEVISLLLPVVSSDPFDKASLRKIVLAQERLQQKAAIITLLEKVVAQDASDVESRLKLQELSGNRGPDNRASAEISIVPSGNAWTLDHAKAFYKRIYTEPTALNQAEEALLVVTREQPNNAEAWILLGKVRYEQGKYPESANILETWLKKFPRDLDAWVMAVAAQTRVGDASKALLLVQEAGFLFPGQPALLHAQSGALIAAGKLKDAQNILNESAAIIRSDFAHVPAFHMAQYDAEGDLLQKQGNLIEARKRWQAALAIDPNQATIRAKLEFQNQ